MRLYNRTSFPTKLLKEIIAFVKPKYFHKDRRMSIRVMTYTDYARSGRRGSTHGGIGGIAHWWEKPPRESIVVPVPRRGNHIIRVRFRGLDIRFKNDVDWFVFLFAHEFQHVRQFRLGYIRGVCVSGLEEDADKHAITMLKKWRKSHAKKNK